jgi:xanthine dehydrogenase accessory factor
MKDVLEEVVRWSDAGERVALATVVGVRRSAPRAPGAVRHGRSGGRLSERSGGRIHEVGA